MEYDVEVRPAEPQEALAMPRLEVASGELFRELGMELVADAPPPPTAGFVDAQREDRLLVGVVHGEVAGFVRVEPLDDALYVEQVSVAPAYARRGVGTRLILAAEELARSRGLSRLTVTTYRDVPFNGPFYLALGWHVLPEDDLPPGLAAVRRAEAAAGLDQWPRQAMAKRSRSPSVAD